MVRFNDKWPKSLSILRHGQSAANVAHDLAQETKAHTLDFDFRDMDVPLSELGHRQAQAIGRHIANEKPDIILVSSYLRAKQTAQEVHAQVGGTIEMVFDERLREREFGILDGLTYAGVNARFPEEAARREKIGKFYYRAPGGESWADVILRLRSVLDSLARDYADKRVLIVAHNVVILCLRYLFETMTEEELMKLDQDVKIANCSLTTYRFESGEGTAGRPVLETFNFVAPL